MSHNSQRTLLTEDTLRTTIDASTCIAPVQPVSHSDIGGNEINFDEFGEPLEPDIASMSMKSEIDGRYLTTFATHIHDDKADGCGFTTIRQCSKDNLDWDYGYECSTIEQCEDGALERTLRLNMFEHGAGTAASYSEINSHQSMLPPLNDNPYDADVEELPGPSRATEVFARRVKHSRLGRRSREVVQKLSEDALMRRYLDTYKCLTSHLKAPLEGQRIARLSHIFQGGRTFGFASALIKAGSRKFVIVCVIWQTRVNPRRAVCVSFYKNAATRILTAICTCCSLRRQSQQDESTCCHSRVCFDSEELVSSVQEILNVRTEMIGNKFVQFPHFCVCIDVEDPESPQTVKLSLKRTRQAHAYAGKWKFEIVFDVSQSIFLPVLKEQHRATRCLSCRGNPERRMRCVHEKACRRGRHKSEVQAHLRETHIWTS